MTEEEAVGCVKMWIRKKASLKLVKILCFIGKRYIFIFRNKNCRVESNVEKV